MKGEAPWLANKEIVMQSKKMTVAGWILGVPPSLLFIFSATMKFLRPPELIEGFAHLGLPENISFQLGLLELFCAVVYLVPRTAVIGAILLTGYLGGAILTHLRIGEPFFMHAILGVALWGGIYLRDPRLRELIPIRRKGRWGDGV